MVGYLITPAPTEPNRVLVRAVYLASIGYLLSYWGGSETMHKRRLALLKYVSRLSNPRFGVDQTIDSIMRKLREFYDADTCLLINTGPVAKAHTVRRINRRHAEAAERVESVGDETSQLLAWHSGWAVTWRNESRRRWLSK